MNFKKIIPTLFSALSGLFPELSAKVALEMFCYPGRSQRRAEEYALLESATEIRFTSGRIGHHWGIGPVIFLCHGWGSRGTRFFNLIERLVKQDFSVVVWDAPAHGYSPGKKTTLPEIAEALAEDLLSSKINPVGFVGHSMGGAILGIVQKYYRKLPNKIVLVSAPTRISEVFERYFAMIKLKIKARKIFVRNAISMTGFTFKDLSLVSTDLGKDNQLLVIHDMGDKEVPYSDFEALRDRWDQSIFETTIDLGHRRILDDDEVLNKIVNYFNKPLIYV